MTLLAGVLLVVALSAQNPVDALTTDELTRVRELYALASYEEALARLDAAGPRISAERAAQYRALCLLGLSRVADAQRTLERLVMDHPTYALPEEEVSPRLYALFRETRERLLPAAARARYTAAKIAFDQRQFARAADGFRDVQTLLADPVFVTEVDGLRDLKDLSAGFLALAEASASAAPASPEPVRTVASTAPASAAPTPWMAATSPPVPEPVSASTESATTPAPAMARPPAPPTIYSDEDPSVQPPVEVQRRLPPWNPPPALSRMELRGQLEVVIDDSGNVAAATIVKSVHPAYDEALVGAAERWRFEPATRDGVPVPYRKTFEILLNPR
jgi:TonB family protein